MPYIDEEQRNELDECINHLTKCIVDTKVGLMNPSDFSNFLGRINYCFSRIIMGVMKDISYKNIAMATGVLENIKQELYRRIAHRYEDLKVVENGDIKEYMRFNNAR
jgi:hypothetical protein